MKLCRWRSDGVHHPRPSCDADTAREQGAGRLGFRAAFSAERKLRSMQEGSVMGRSRKRKGLKRPQAEPTVCGPFAGTYWRLRRLAKARRLFVLFDGDPESPRLTFFDTAQGVALLDYWPNS